MSILTSLVQSCSKGRGPQRRKLLVCCSVSIRYSTITVCIVGHPFGHGWAVVVISAREVKSASSGGLKNLTFHRPIDVFSLLITKARHTSGAFYAVIMPSVRR